MAKIEPMAPSETIITSRGHLYECLHLACNSADLGELSNWTRAKDVNVAAGSDCLVQDTCEVYTYRPETDSWEELG